MFDGHRRCATWDGPTFGSYNLLSGCFQDLFLIAKRRLSVSILYSPLKSACARKNKENEADET